VRLQAVWLVRTCWFVCSSGAFWHGPGRRRPAEPCSPLSEDRVGCDLVLEVRVREGLHCPAAHLCHELTMEEGGPGTAYILFARCLFSSWTSLAHQLPVVLQITLVWMSHCRGLLERNSLVQPSWNWSLSAF